MKLVRDPDLGAEPVCELDERDLADAERLAVVAAQLEPDTLVYAPVAQATAAETVDPRSAQPDPSGDWWRDPPPCRMHSEKLDSPARLDALRVALASHGLELQHVGCFYARVTALRAESKRCAS